MCGRFALPLLPAQVRAYLEDEHMPVDDAPPDEGEGAPRQSYNFAPGYHGLVYRADTPDWGAGPRPSPQDGEAKENDDAAPTDTGDKTEVRYKLQSMKWGLVPFWTKRNPNYGSLMKTINCRDDSLIENKGMWNTMKQRKRCIVVFQGFYEWLNKGKQKVPHYVKRKDGKLMCAAGLWDCVQYEGSNEKLYTFTVITTSSNKQLNFLHDRMPVILENGSEELRTWLDPKRVTWSKELQSLLKPFDGELEVYPVSQEVGKVGNNSPNFIIPVASSENKSNIANFFAKGAANKSVDGNPSKKPTQASSATIKQEENSVPIKQEPDENRETIDHSGTEDNAPLPIPKTELNRNVKRELGDSDIEEPPAKALKTSTTSIQSSSMSKPAAKTKSATSNVKSSPKKTPVKDKGTPKITSFFKK